MRMPSMATKLLNAMIGSYLFFLSMDRICAFNLAIKPVCTKWYPQTSKLSNDLNSEGRHCSGRILCSSSTRREIKQQEAEELLYLCTQHAETGKRA